MNEYLFAKVDSTRKMKGVPPYIESSKIYDSLRDFEERSESNAIWSQPITKNGRLIRERLNLPDEIIVVSKSLSSFFVDIYPAFGGLIIKNRVWDKFSQNTRGNFIKASLKLNGSMNKDFDCSYTYLKHSKEIKIVDDDSSLLVGASKFSGRFKRITQLDLGPNAPEVFFIGDLSGYWAVSKTWLHTNFSSGVVGLDLKDNEDFCSSYNNVSIFDAMIGMNKNG